MNLDDIPITICETTHDIPTGDMSTHDGALEVAVGKYLGRFGVYPKRIYRWAWYWYLPVPEDDELPLFSNPSR